MANVGRRKVAPVNCLNHKSYVVRQQVSRGNGLRHTQIVVPRNKYRWRKRPNARHALTLIARLIRRRLRRNMSYFFSGLAVHPNEEKHTSRNTLPLVDSILQRRIQICQILNKGAKLIRRFSICSLTSWGKQTLKTASFWSLSDNKSQDSNSSAASTCDSDGGRYSICKKPSLSSPCNPMADCNRNAIRPDTEGKVDRFEDTVLGNGQRKTKGRRKLGARSTGRPKPTVQVRRKNTNRLGGRNLMKSKNMKKSSRLKRKESRKNNVSFRESTGKAGQLLLGENTAMSAPVQRVIASGPEYDMRKVEKVTRCTPAALPLCKAVAKEDENDKPTTKKTRGKIPKKENHLDFFEAGPSHQYPDFVREAKGKCHGKELTKEPAGQNCEDGSGVKTGPFSSVLSSPSLRLKSTEWPSLTEIGRQKGLTKEVATEIVANKQSGSVMKITSSKRWADIAAIRTREGNPSIANAIRTVNAPNNRTWASVAAKTIGKFTDISSRQRSLVDSHPFGVNTVNEISHSPNNKPPSSSTSLTGKLKRKGGSRLPQTINDRLLVDGPLAKGVRHSQKACLKHFGAGGDIFRNRETIRNRRNKIKQRNESEKAHTPSRGQGKTGQAEGFPGKVPERTTPKRNKQDWCIDTMSVIYTQPVSTVISLNVPSYGTADISHEVHKCNNRKMTPVSTQDTLNRAITRSTARQIKAQEKPGNSRKDLRELFGVVSFQAATNGWSQESNTQSGKSEIEDNITHCQMDLKTRGLRAIHQQKEFPRQTLEDKECSKPKKTSSRYRALLRGENGRLDAKTVTELHTRSKKTDSLRQDKVLTRALQKQQRQQRQRTQHNSQRPSVSTESSERDSLSWVVDEHYLTESSEETYCRNLVAPTSERSGFMPILKDKAGWTPRDSTSSNNAEVSSEQGGKRIWYSSAMTTPSTNESSRQAHEANVVI